MTNEYQKMVLALPADFFQDWVWQEGDKFLCHEPTKRSDKLPHNPIEYGWIIHTIGDHELYEGEIYKKDYELAYKKRKDKIRPLPSQKQLLEIYKKKQGDQFESLSLLWFANWFEAKVTEYHSFCLKNRSSDCIVLMFVQEKCYNKKWDGKAWT